MAILKQNTAYTRQFLLVLSSDHITGATVAANTLTVYLGKAGAAGTLMNGTVARVDNTNLPGIYKLNYTSIDTNTIGDMVTAVTASTCDPVNFIDRIDPQIFPDLSMSAGTGRVFINDNLQQNSSLNGYTFLMVNAAGAPLTGLTVTAQRSLGGAGFAPCANSVTELSNGLYTINFAASDLNSATVLFRATAPGAADLDIELITTP